MSEKVLEQGRRPTVDEDNWESLRNDRSLAPVGLRVVFFRGPAYRTFKRQSWAFVLIVVLASICCENAIVCFPCLLPAK